MNIDLLLFDQKEEEVKRALEKLQLDLVAFRCFHRNQFIALFFLQADSGIHFFHGLLGYTASLVVPFF